MRYGRSIFSSPFRLLEERRRRENEAHRKFRLVRLPREAGTVPVSWLKQRSLHAGKIGRS